MVSVEFESAYAECKKMLDPLNIGGRLAEKECTEAGVPEEYAAEGLRRGMMPATIIKLWNEGISLNFVGAFLEGKKVHGMWTTADAAVYNIIFAHYVFQNAEMPSDYCHQLMSMGVPPMRISTYWSNGVALEYAQQMTAEQDTR